MNVPSDAQARLLTRIAQHADSGEEVYWAPGDPAANRKPAALFYETLDRETNRGGFRQLFEFSEGLPIEATVSAVVRHGWIDDSQERVDVSGLPIIGVHIGAGSKPEPVFTRQLDLTEDGKIALGLWRQRRLQSMPTEVPALSVHEREVVELAARALELGYGLCAREPARKEARRLRKQGWFDRRGAWVANSATALVPTATALCEVRPEQADTPLRERTPA